MCPVLMRVAITSERLIVREVFRMHLADDMRFSGVVVQLMFYEQ
jgi:hypothetical protein